jgi:hypothetical protein
MTALVKCPCGGESFRRRIPVTGLWVETLTPNEQKTALEVEEATTDHIQEKHQPKTMRCDTCGRRVANPDYKP